MLSALCLGIGTMIGYKRIVKTLGERLGKIHLTPAQGASAGGAHRHRWIHWITSQHYAYSDVRNRGHDGDVRRRTSIRDGLAHSGGVGAHLTHHYRDRRRPLLSSGESKVLIGNLMTMRELLLSPD